MQNSAVGLEERLSTIYPRAAPTSDQPQVSAAGIGSLAFLRGFIVTMRPYLLFVSGITGIAGLSLAPEMAVASTLLLGLAFFLSYGFGQALTDCFQLDTDSLSAPYRPLVRGAIRRRDVMTASLIGLSAIGLVLALYNPVNVALAALAIAGLATYTHFKRRWWGGPFYNAWIVAVVALIGYACGVGAAGARLSWSSQLAGTLLCVFFGYANFVLAGYYKDVSADRATGYRTMPVVFGLRVSSTASEVFALLGLLGCVLAVSAAMVEGPREAGHIVALALLAAGAAASLLAQTRLHRVKSEAAAHWAIAPVVHAYILMLAAIAASQQPDWAPALALFYVGFVLTMRRRPMREQI